jgi:hypothetical protein
MYSVEDWAEIRRLHGPGQSIAVEAAAGEQSKYE